MRYLISVCLALSFATARPAQATPLVCELALSGADSVTLATYDWIQKFIQSQPNIQAAIAVLNAKKREGWLRRGIPRKKAETVLKHSEKGFYAVMRLPAERSLNRARMGWMAYFHDLAEYEVPDYTPHDKISTEEKHRLERLALEKLLRGVGHEGQLILELWHEYEQQKTAEAKIVTQLDKLDAAVQALEYENQGYEVSDFFFYTMNKLTNPKLIHIYSGLLQKRRADLDFYSVYFSELSKTY